ncbi:MAG: DUF6602 domain-containing protein [Limisphaerales bacterium]
MKINNYILERLRADAAHAIALAECENAIQHFGLRGRLREILIANLLAPWLPPFCKCATGMIVETKNKPRKSTQEDILVIDPSIAPPILANVGGPEGIFHLNSVLLRIEVKSTLNQKGLSDFIDASLEIIKMEFNKTDDCKSKFAHPASILVAFKSGFSSQKWDYEYRRFRDIMKKKKCPPALSGFVSAICVVDKGFWFLNDYGGRQRSWVRLDSIINDDPNLMKDRLVRLIAKASTVAYRAHVERQGRDSTQGLEVGIESFIPPATVYQLPE